MKTIEEEDTEKEEKEVDTQRKIIAISPEQLLKEMIKIQ